MKIEVNDRELKLMSAKTLAMLEGLVLELLTQADTVVSNRVGNTYVVAARFDDD